MPKFIDEYGNNDSPSFGQGINRGPEGYWKPIYPSEVSRPLKHAEADYNYKILSINLSRKKILYYIKRYRYRMNRVFAKIKKIIVCI